MRAIVVERAGGPEKIADDVAAGRYGSGLDKVFHFHEIVDAHRYMEASHASGKVVVVVD